MHAKLAVKNVSKTFPVKSGVGGNRTNSDFVALQNINFEVASGEFMVLVGPSGCGKSTLLDLLGGLTKPTSGEILLDGKAVNGPGLDRGVVFQQYALFPWKTAQGNVEFGLEAKGIAKKERKELAEYYLQLVGLSGFEGRYPHELSGGMKQRVAIARSLSYDPDVLLMDEPFAALDAQTRETLQGELLRIWEKTKKTIIFITHGIDEAVYLGQRVAVMAAHPGRIVKMIEIHLDSRTREEDDLRSLPAFNEIRHEIWSMIRTQNSAS